ncbi:hypothetical protein RRG08_028731, partial [Elysia crispata]
ALQIPHPQPSPIFPYIKIPLTHKSAQLIWQILVACRPITDRNKQNRKSCEPLILHCLVFDRSSASSTILIHWSQRGNLLGVFESHTGAVSVEPAREPSRARVPHRRGECGASAGTFLACSSPTQSWSTSGPVTIINLLLAGIVKNVPVLLPRAAAKLRPRDGRWLIPSFRLERASGTQLPSAPGLDCRTRRWSGGSHGQHLTT